MTDTYHIAVSMQDEEWPCCATRLHETLKGQSVYPHEVIEAYAKRHATVLAPGDVVVAHRERDHRNFIGKVEKVVGNPVVTFA